MSPMKETMSIERAHVGLVQRLSPNLTGRQRRQLRGLAHELHAVVTIGHSGVTTGVIGSLHDALAAHELVKVKFLDTCEEDLSEAAALITQRTSSSLVQKIGHVLVIYRPDPDEPKLQLVSPK